MKKTMWSLALGAGLAACTGTQDVLVTRPAAAHESMTAATDDDDDADDDDDQEELIDLGLVPESVKQAARAAVPGIVFVSAEKELENGAVVYSLEGTAGGRQHEVEVSADGKVLEIEHGDDEEEEEDD